MNKAEEVLSVVKMLDWAEYHPAELSSGQQQKVALARAMITNPSVIIADEPTGNLDFESGEELMSLLHGFSEKDEKTILMVTHDLEYLKYADRAVKLFDGKVQKVFSPDVDLEEMKEANVKRKIYEQYTEE
jgi:putative ABC transport system ATP-binding protein